MKKNIIVTGFEPFGDFKRNASKEVAKSLSETKSEWLDYHVNCFPYSGGIPFDIRGLSHELGLLFSYNKPDFLVMMGQTFNPRQTELVLERNAINHVNYNKDNLSDNTGYRPETGKIINDGPERYSTRISIDLIVERLHERGIPADTSNYCGSNFCNQSYYTTLFFEEEHLRNRNIQQGYKIVVENPNHERYVSSLLGQSQPEFKTVFVHLPQYPDQTGGLGGREFSDQCKDVKALIDEIVKAESDEKITDRLLRCAKKSYNKHFRNF